MKRPLVSTLASALLLLSVAVAALVPAWRAGLWGANSWTYLSGSSAGIAAVAALLLTWLVFQAPPWPARSLSVLLVVLLSGGLFTVLRDRTHLLGDGQLWLAVLRDNPVGHPHEPLAFGGAHLAALTAGKNVAAIPGRVEFWNILLGCAMVALMLALSRRIGSDRFGRWLSFGTLLSLGAIAFAFGYVEAYGALSVAVLLFLVTGFDALHEPDSRPDRQGREAKEKPGGSIFLAPVLAPALAWGLAAGVHGSGFLLFPALLIVALKAKGPVARRIVPLSFALVPLAIAYVVVPQFLGASPGPGNRLDFVTGRWSELIGELAFHRGSVADWLLGQVNRLTLIGGAAVALLVARAVTGRPDPTIAPEATSKSKRKDAATAGTPAAGNSLALFLSLAFAGLYLPALLLDMEGSRGAAADWDAYAVAAIPLGGLAAWAWRLDAKDRSTRLGLALILGVGFFGTASFVLLNASPPAALARFETLASTTFQRPRSQGWAWETLALYRREAGDLAGAAEAYNRAASRLPDNGRLLRNAAATLGRAGRSRDAAQALRQLTVLEPADYSAWLHLGMEWSQAGAPDSAVTAYRQAMRLKPDSPDAMNELARLLIQNPASRHEGAELIRRSLTINPNQQYAVEMRKALAQLEAGGY